MTNQPEQWRNPPTCPACGPPVFELVNDRENPHRYQRCRWLVTIQEGIAENWLNLSRAGEASFHVFVMHSFEGGDSQ